MRPPTKASANYPIFISVKFTSRFPSRVWRVVRVVMTARKDPVYRRVYIMKFL